MQTNPNLANRKFAIQIHDLVSHWDSRHNLYSNGINDFAYANRLARKKPHVLVTGSNSPM